MQVSGVKAGQRRLIIDSNDINGAGDRRGVVQGTGGADIAAVVERHRDCARRVGVCPGRVLAGAGEGDLSEQGFRCCQCRTGRGKCNHQIGRTAARLGTNLGTVVQHI